MGSSVLIEKKENIVVISLNRPDVMNSLERELVEELKSALRDFEKDDDSRVAVLTGQGKAFCAGGSLAVMKEGLGVGDAMAYMNDANEIIELIIGMSKPVIAAVNGAAVGAGFNMALACDVVIASSNAFFSQVFSKVGLVPDMGGLYHLPRVVGMQRAKELIYTARTVRAEEALQIGIACLVVTPEELETSALDMAVKIAKGPSVAFRLGKRILSTTLENTLQDVLQQEALAQTICLQTEDHKEGIQSFYEKRTPVFRGK